MPAEQIDGKVSEFQHAAEGADLEIAPGFTVKKHIDLGGVSFERTYDEPLAPRAIVLGVAYAFLALTLGERVYRDELEPVREVLRRAFSGNTAAADASPIDCLALGVAAGGDARSGGEARGGRRPGQDLAVSGARRTRTRLLREREEKSMSFELSPQQLSELVIWPSC